MENIFDRLLETDDEALIESVFILEITGVWTTQLMLFLLFDQIGIPWDKSYEVGGLK